MFKKTVSALLMGLLLISPSYAASKKEPTLTKPENLPKYVVTSVVDGDTIKVKDAGNKEYTVRMILIDTPESVHPKKEKNTKEGKIASDYTKSVLVKDTPVELEKDVSGTDRYGRILAYVWYKESVKDASGKVKQVDKMYNAKLLEEGYATVYSYPPDIKYIEEFRSIQQKAQDSKKGFWGKDYAEVFSSTEQKPSTKTQPAKPSAPAAQTSAKGKIKGNINTKTKEKIYHVPGGKYYDRTQIDESKGERWFNTEEEAIAAGWRKASD